ncbi:hypothetical protein [Arsenicicoccus sp. oral taxon 190]|uniref:hypothetical protein n=1 Tax=Arsenicicoccus sp. oral taxon 190 TaxID=1658671 RepID=UPI00067E0209|nr:hypothetical protein [Arsenicicoccus sp. oral taxon 190]
MHPRTAIPPHLLQLAERRGGLLARAELLAAGLSRPSVDGVAARATTVLPGIYLVSGASNNRAPLDAERRAWAGVLHAGRGAALAGRAAGHHLGLLDRPPAIIEIAVPHRRTIAPQSGYAFVRHRPDVHAEPLPRDLPTLRVEDVVLDLAATGSDSDAIGFLTAACQRGLTQAPRLLARLGARRRHPRRALLVAVLEDVATGTASHLEHGYVTHVERAHRLPPATRQFVVPGTGHRRDGAYERERLLLEHDGSAFHDGMFRLADLALDTEHLGLGWSTIRTSHQLVFTQACELAMRIDTARVARGGRPCFTPCRRYPPGMAGRPLAA